MNRFYAARMQALDVPYIETLPRTVDAEGRYMPYLPARRGGERRMARVNDGIHMTIPGYIHVMEGLSERIRRTIDGPTRQVGRGPAAAATERGG
jgi:hypothetical protein